MSYAVLKNPPRKMALKHAKGKVNFTSTSKQNEEQQGDVVKNRIEEIRKERGIKQDDFAKSMGVSRQTISSLENGRYNPSIILAFKIAKYFDTTIEEVFLIEEDDLK